MYSDKDEKIEILLFSILIIFFIILGKNIEHLLISPLLYLLISTSISGVISLFLGEKIQNKLDKGEKKDTK